MLLTVAIPSLLAAEKSYTIMLDKTTTTKNSPSAIEAKDFIATAVSSGSEYISEVTVCDKVYPLLGENGVRIGSSSNVGTLTIALSQLGGVIPTKITVNCKKFTDTSKLTLKYTTSEGTKTVDNSRSPVADWTDFNYTITNETAQMTSITLSTTKRASFKSITVYYYEADTELTAPVISGVENGGEYMNGATVNISKPDKATSISYTVKKDEVEVDKATAKDAISKTYTEPGTYTVSASATDGTNTLTAEDVTFTIKSNKVTSIAEFLATAPSYTDIEFEFNCKLFVTYVSGKNLYVRDAAGTPLLIYMPQTATTQFPDGVKNGDFFNPGVTGTYQLYKKTISRLNTTTLPDCYNGSEALEPNLITIGQAADNMSQYVKIKNVKFNSATKIACGDETLTVYDVNEAVPTDMTAQYTVTGVISYHDDVQINLIAVTEENVLGTPEIEVAGDTNATGFYLDKATLKFVNPANATSMEYVVKKGETVLGQAKNLKEDATCNITTCGEISIEMTAYMGDEDLKIANKTIKIIPSAPTVSLAAGTYYETQTLTITAPAGATLDGALGDETISGTTFSTTLELVAGETKKYELLVSAVKDDVSSDIFSAVYTIDGQVVAATVTGTIDLDDFDDSNFITNGANMVAEQEYSIKDNFGTIFTFSAVKGGGSNMPFRSNASTSDQFLRLYWANNSGNVLTISSDVTINKVAISTKSALKIDGEQIAANNQVVEKEYAEGCTSFTIEPTANKQDLFSFTITYNGKMHYDKVKDGAALIGMEKGKFYQVNVNLQGVEANGGVLYARTAEASAAPSEPGKNYFDKSYEDYDLTKFDQRDWVAIEGNTELEGKTLATGFIARYDGVKLTPVAAIEPQDDAASYTLNTFGVANVFYGNYENTENVMGGYTPFFVKAKVNEVANFVGKVTKDTSEEGSSFRLEGSGKCGVFEGKGVLLEAADGVTLSVSGEDYKEFKGVLVAETNNTLAQCDVKIVALTEPGTPTGVAALKADGKATVYGTEGAVVVNGADGKVMIFDAMGRMVKSVSAEGAATVAMPAGYYIVRTAGTAAKVMVK